MRGVEERMGETCLARPKETTHWQCKQDNYGDNAFLLSSQKVSTFLTVCLFVFSLFKLETAIEKKFAFSSASAAKNGSGERRNQHKKREKARRNALWHVRLLYSAFHLSCSLSSHHALRPRSRTPRHEEHIKKKGNIMKDKKKVKPAEGRGIWVESYLSQQPDPQRKSASFTLNQNSLNSFRQLSCSQKKKSELLFYVSCDYFIFRFFFPLTVHVSFVERSCVFTAVFFFSCSLSLFRVVRKESGNRNKEREKLATRTTVSHSFTLPCGKKEKHYFMLFKQLLRPDRQPIKSEKWREGENLYVQLYLNTCACTSRLHLAVYKVTKWDE